MWIHHDIVLLCILRVRFWGLFLPLPSLHCDIALLRILIIWSMRLVLISLSFLVFLILLQILRSLGPIIHSYALLLFILFSKPSYTYYQCFLSWMALSWFCNFDLCDHNCGICNIQYCEEPHKNYFLEHFFHILCSLQLYVQS
jgi:hypothetical protein